MSITNIIRPLFAPRYRKIETFATEAEALQMKVLRRLLHEARDTEWGRIHDFGNTNTYEQFAHSEVNDYEALKGAIDRMRHGERDVLWPGQVRWYAKSRRTAQEEEPVALVPEN